MSGQESARDTGETREITIKVMEFDLVVDPGFERSIAVPVLRAAMSIFPLL